MAKLSYAAWRRGLAALAFGALSLPFGGCAVEPGAAPDTRSPAVPSSAVSGAPPLQVETVASGFDHPWDLGFLPTGEVLVTERPGRIALLSAVRPGAIARPVRADLSSVYARGEGGLMGLLVHPDFATSREFTMCQTYAEGGAPVDIRLVTWRLALDGGSAVRVRDLVTGLPIAASGRHSGCRMALDATGALVVGTGDTADPRVPQDGSSLGGKVLRVRLADGAPPPDNPFAASSDPRRRRVLSYGHRNIQGIALRPGTNRIWTAEHGPSFDDEVNEIVPGGNYGWDPSRGGSQGGYDESVPMTDLERFPDAVPAVWASGTTTEAICGLAFLGGTQWRGDTGAAVVTALKGAKLLVLRLDAAGAVTSVRAPAELQGYGRLRAVREAPDGSLWITTSNGGNDRILRVTPG